MSIANLLLMLVVRCLIIIIIIIIKIRSQNRRWVVIPLLSA